MKSLSLSQPHLIVLTGVKGSGKTFFAEKFAETFHAPCVSRDRIAEFAPDDKAADSLAAYQLDELLKTRQPVVADGLATTRTQRAELAKKAREAGYATLLIWVQTDPATAKSRALRATKKLGEDEYEHAAKRFTAPGAVEKPMVISGKHTYASQAKVVLKRLTAPRAEAVSVHKTAPVRPEATGRRNITIR